MSTKTSGAPPDDASNEKQRTAAPGGRSQTENAVPPTVPRALPRRGLLFLIGIIKKPEQETPPAKQ
jgi:hypothetical protein